MEASEGGLSLGGMIALFAGVLGLGAGTIASSIAVPLWPRELSRWRAILGGVVAAWLCLKIIGRVEVLMGSRSSSFSLSWDMAGGIIGLAGGMVAFAPIPRVLRLSIGFAAGAILLMIQGLLLAKPWAMVVCLFSGAIAGGASGFLTESIVKARQDWGRWVLLTLLIWSILESLVGDFILFLALVILGGMGMALALIIRTIVVPKSTARA